jgi:excisionase family DNA binding protein
MGGDFYTAFEVAERLKLHVKTVLAFIRDGRLKATRIGKQYRIAAADLAAFTGASAPQSDDIRRHRNVEVSSIVEIDAISVEAANRTTTHLLGTLNGRPPGDGRARVDTIYYEERARLKIIISGSVETTSRLLGLISVLIAE